MKKLATVLLIVLLASPAVGQTITTPHVTGTLQSPSQWDPAADPMVETAPGSLIWELSFTGLTPGNREEYKITDGTWGNTLPLPGNSWLYADGAGDVTITYDANTYADGWSPDFDRFGLNTDVGAWTAVGSWQSQVGGGDWDNANPFTAMAPQGGGIYMMEAVLTPGNYDWKAVATGSWDAISWDARSVNSANWSFTTDAVNDTARFWVDSFTGTAKLEVVPEPTTLVLLGIGGMVLLRRRR